MKNQTTFTIVSTDLMVSPKLTPVQKLLIAYVIGWQSNNKVCTESNSSLAKNIGVSLQSLKNQIQILNKLPFFKSELTSHFNEFGKWSNSKEIRIDEAALCTYLKEEVTITSTPKKETMKPETKNEPVLTVKPKMTFLDELQEIEDDSITEKQKKSKELEIELGAISTPVSVTPPLKVTSQQLMDSLNSQSDLEKIQDMQRKSRYTDEQMKVELTSMGLENYIQYVGKN